MKGWNMKGALSLGTVRGLNIDLPPQTILDVELVEETTVRCFTLKTPEWLGIDIRSTPILDYTNRGFDRWQLSFN